MGLSRVRDLVLGLSIWNTLDGKDPVGRRYRKQMWAHTSMVAATAKVLAERTGGDGGAAFAAGLLHDVGKLVLGLQLGDSYWSMLDMAREQRTPTAEIEREAFGCDHATVGGWLLQIWQLPRRRWRPVALHHDPLVRSSAGPSPRWSRSRPAGDATDPASGSRTRRRSPRCASRTRSAVERPVARAVGRAPARAAGVGALFGG